MSRILTPEAEAERVQFHADGYPNCSCHISPPCGSCTHPGNPLNQDEDDSCWIEVHLFAVNDCEFWIGAGSAIEIMAAYTEATGVTEEDNGGLPEQITEEALDGLQFHDCDENEQPTGAVRSFREQLAIEVAEGGEFPRLFAVTDY
jgi:hypothetical protein